MASWHTPALSASHEKHFGLRKYHCLRQCLLPECRKRWVGTEWWAQTKVQQTVHHSSCIKEKRAESWKQEQTYATTVIPAMAMGHQPQNMVSQGDHTQTQALQKQAVLCIYEYIQNLHSYNNHKFQFTSLTCPFTRIAVIQLQRTYYKQGNALSCANMQTHIMTVITFHAHVTVQMHTQTVNLLYECTCNTRAELLSHMSQPRSAPMPGYIHAWQSTHVTAR